VTVLFALLALNVIQSVLL